MNQVTISGRLVRDIELRYLNSGLSVAKFTLAVDKDLAKDKKDELQAQGKPTADFINCQVFGKLAENAAKFTTKGLRVLVNGRIQTGSFQNQKGQTVYTTDVVANQIEFIDFKNSNTNAAATQTVQTNQAEFEYIADFDPAEDSRLPF